MKKIGNGPNVGHIVHHLIGKTNNILIEANSVISFFNSNGLVNNADKAAVLYNSKEKSILLNVSHSVHHLIGKTHNILIKANSVTSFFNSNGLVNNADKAAVLYNSKICPRHLWPHPFEISRPIK